MQKRISRLKDMQQEMLKGFFSAAITSAQIKRTALAYLNCSVLFAVLFRANDNEYVKCMYMADKSMNEGRQATELKQGDYFMLRFNEGKEPKLSKKKIIVPVSSLSEGVNTSVLAYLAQRKQIALFSADEVEGGSNHDVAILKEDPDPPPTHFLSLRSEKNSLEQEREFMEEWLQRAVTGLGEEELSQELIQEIFSVFDPTLMQPFKVVAHSININYESKD